MATTESLWPVDIGDTIRTPAAILREQADKLSELTQGMVKGDVKALSTVSDGDFQFGLHLVAPLLNYRYLLCWIQHNVHLYPLWLHVDEEVFQQAFPSVQSRDMRVIANNESDFKVLLGEIFKAPKTRQVIQALVAQSSALKEFG